MDDTQNQIPLVKAIPPEIFAFLQSLLMDAGINNQDEETYNLMIEEMYVRLDKFLIAKIVESLPEEKLEEFATLTEKNPTPQQVQDYLAANMPDAQAVFSTAFGEFRDVYITGAKNAAEEFDKEEEEAELLEVAEEPTTTDNTQSS